VRILYVSHSFPPPNRPLANVGGMQRVATELHAALAVHPRVQLHDLVLRATWRWTHARFAPFAASLMYRIPREVERHGIDAVLFSSMVTASLAFPLRGRIRSRGAVTAAIPVGRDVTLPVAPYQWLVPRVLRSLDAVYPISRATAAECLTRGASPERVRVIPCGVDIDRFPPVAVDRAEARAAMVRAFGSEPLPADALVLCSVGRHVERKGFVWFTERVMPRLPPAVRFWLAGEGPRTPAIREAIARRGLGDRVRLLGRVSDDDLATLLRGSDLFVMPNRSVPGDMEGFGVVMLEAGLAGLPVVAAGIEGIVDAVTEGENGHLLPAGDEAAFVERILNYHGDRGALSAAAERAAIHTRRTFAWPAIADRYVRDLETVVQHARGPVPARTTLPLDGDPR
jgi:phosphatidyl-myo-inositol dimannoside synthase